MRESCSPMVYFLGALCSFSFLYNILLFTDQKKYNYNLGIQKENCYTRKTVMHIIRLL